MNKTILTDAKGKTTVITDDNREMQIPSKKTITDSERLLAEYTALVIRNDRLKNHLLDLPDDTEADAMVNAMWEQVSGMTSYENALRKRLLLTMGVEVKE